MNIVFGAKGFYFSGKVADFRRFLKPLASPRRTVTEYLAVHWQ